MKTFSKSVKNPLFLVAISTLLLNSIDTLAQRRGNRNVSAPRQNVMATPKKAMTEPEIKPEEKGVQRQQTREELPENKEIKVEAINNKTQENINKNTVIENRKDVENRNTTTNTTINNRNTSTTVYNTRNTVVIKNTQVYPRPAYRFNGYIYNTYNPYFYHAYNPFYWGPFWYPWGSIITTIPTTSIIINEGNIQYQYDQGVWYNSSNDGYIVVPAPIGAIVSYLPDGSQMVNAGNTTYYYYGGSYYQKDGTLYKVVPPMAGTIVNNLPEGGKEVIIGDMKYVKFGQTYYQPVQIEGRNKYEVVLMELDQ